MYVDFEFSGGYAFLCASYQGSTDEMTQENSKKFTDLVKNSGILELKQSDISNGTKKGIDLFNYKVSISNVGRKTSLSFDDMSVPEKIRPLLECLKELAIEQTQRDR